MKDQKKRIITFGTFDLLHIGHVRIFERARALGDSLIVGISTDALNFAKKGIFPTYDESARLDIVQAIRYVDEVFLEESLEKKKEYIVQHKADILVMGDDWKGKFDWCNDVCEVIYLERTPDISSSQIKEELRQAV